MATRGNVLEEGDGSLSPSYILAPNRIRYNFQAPTISFPADMVTNTFNGGSASLALYDNRPTILLDAGTSATGGAEVYFEDKKWQRR